MATIEDLLTEEQKKRLAEIRARAQSADNLYTRGYTINAPVGPKPMIDTSGILTTAQTMSAPGMEAASSGRSLLDTYVDRMAQERSSIPSYQPRDNIKIRPEYAGLAERLATGGAERQERVSKLDEMLNDLLWKAKNEPSINRAKVYADLANTLESAIAKELGYSTSEYATRGGLAERLYGSDIQKQLGEEELRQKEVGLGLETQRNKLLADRLGLDVEKFKTEAGIDLAKLDLAAKDIGLRKLLGMGELALNERKLGYLDKSKASDSYIKFRQKINDRFDKAISDLTTQKKYAIGSNKYRKALEAIEAQRKLALRDLDEAYYGGGGATSELDEYLQ